MKTISKYFFIGFISLFSSVLMANSTVDIKNKLNSSVSKEQSKIQNENEETDIFNCSEDCLRKCEKKELEPVNCKNNSCQCG